MSTIFKIIKDSLSHRLGYIEAIETETEIVVRVLEQKKNAIVNESLLISELQSFRKMTKRSKMKSCQGSVSLTLMV